MKKAFKYKDCSLCASDKVTKTIISPITGKDSVYCRECAKLMKRSIAAWHKLNKKSKKRIRVRKGNGNPLPQFLNPFPEHTGIGIYLARKGYLQPVESK